MKELITPEKRVRQKEILHRYNKYIDKPVKFLIKHNITPNEISSLGFLITLTAAFLVAIGIIYYSILFAWIVPFLLGVAGAFDLFDGEVARRTDKETKAGAFLDSNLDRISDAVFILGMIYGGLVNYLLGYIILFLMIMISYTRSRAENEGITMKGVGFMERAERIIFLLFVLLFEIWYYFLSLLILGSVITISIPIITKIPVTPIFFIGILVYTIALLITVIQRIIYTFKILKNVDLNNENC